jgi:hypothetical protein
MANCPCCCNSMLRHIRNHELHWFCRTCWAEMPLLETIETNRNILAVLVEDIARYQQKNRSCPLLNMMG